VSDLAGVLFLLFTAQIVELAVLWLVFRRQGRMTSLINVMWRRSNVITRRIDDHIGQWEKEQSERA